MVAARRWFCFAGLKNVSILYFLIIEHRWTDILLTVYFPSPSSSIATSNILSRPTETAEFCMTLRSCETRLGRCTRLDLRSRLDARSRSDGRCYYYACLSGG